MMDKETYAYLGSYMADAKNTCCQDYGASFPSVGSLAQSVEASEGSEDQ